MSTLMVLLLVALFVLATLVGRLRLVPLGSFLTTGAALLPQGPAFRRLIVHHAVAVVHVEVFSARNVGQVKHALTTSHVGRQDHRLLPRRRALLLQRKLANVDIVEPVAVCRREHVAIC